MKTLLLPVAGKSSRFKGMRPKWLLTMPDGKLMVEKSVENINIEQFDRVILICLKEHLEKYVSETKLLASLKINISSNIEVCILEKETSCQAETIYECIVKKSINGNIFIKDCDNTFELDGVNGNTIANVDLNKIDFIDASNKSYIQLDDNSVITNIVEKNIISNNFCCGGYGFESAKEFCDTFKCIENNTIGETYISHVIFKMILDGKIFRGIEASKYIDWGTKESYERYCDKFITIFCDVDGVLLENGSKFAENGWATEVIESNIESLKKLQEKGYLNLILTTSRPQTEEKYVEEMLKNVGLVFDRFIGDLPHTRRMLINDFAPTNPYPSAISINLPRNSTELNKYLSYILK